MNLKKKRSTSLIISTYNWPKALRLCLKSILKQTVLPTEIIIADDGSSSDTATLITNFKNNNPQLKITHIWHEDKGFRLAAIRNKAILASSSEYIIQIDGDIIMHPKFIEDHLSIAKKRYFVTGSRVLLAEKITNNILMQEDIDWVHLKKISQNKFNSFRAPILCHVLKFIYKQYGHNKYYVKGCNMAFWRNALIEINGYNEEITGWGAEDEEIGARLMNAGYKKQFLKFGGIQYHLHHRFVDKSKNEQNHNMVKWVINHKIIRCNFGIYNLVKTN